MPWEAPGSTAIVVLAPEVESAVGPLYRAHSTAGGQGMTPHVTLLVPFVPAPELDLEVEDRLRRLFQKFGAFDYVLPRLQRFPDGVLYLAPEPPDPFVALVEALAEAFPGYPPYDGAHETIVPHLTVVEGADEALLAQVIPKVEPQLPIACRAGEATLV